MYWYTEWPILPNISKKWLILFRPVACSNLLRVSNQTGNDVEISIFQPTMSSQRMVVGHILTGILCKGFIL